MGLNWNFQRGGGLKPKNLPWEGYEYFLEQHNIYNWDRKSVSSDAEDLTLIIINEINNNY